MHRIAERGLVVAAQALIVIGTQAAGQTPAERSETTAFIGFSVLPMDSARVLGVHTVLVRNGLIAAIGPDGSVQIPDDARKVEGRGQFLLPALADMHTHSVDDREMQLFVTAGVTTILNLAWSSKEFVQTARHAYARGERLGPVVFEARRFNWPYGGRPGIATMQQARDSVADAKSSGYEFIKVHGFLADSVFEETMRSAAAHSLSVVAHVMDTGYGLLRELTAGVVMIVHAEELLRDDLAADSARLREAVAKFVETGAWLTPTLATFEAIRNTWGNPVRAQEYIASPEAGFLGWDRINAWRRNGYDRQQGDRSRDLELIVEATARMHRAGVPLLLGTDIGVIGMVPGFAAHEELRMLQRAGLSPFEALAAGTRNAGEFVTRFVPGTTPFGMIRTGHRADFIITNANPLDDLNVLREPVAVVVRGRVLDRTQLESVRSSLKHR